MMVMITTALARARRRPFRGFVMAIGVAIGIAALTAAVISPRVAGDLAVRRAIEDLPIEERSVSLALSSEGNSAQDVAVIDGDVRRRIGAIGIADVRLLVLYRTLSAQNGTVVRVAGAQDLPTAVEVIDGRLPQTCSVDECEVVAITDAPLSNLADLVATSMASFTLRVVGTARLTDPFVLTGTFSPERNETVLLGDPQILDVGALGSVRSALGWVAPLAVADLSVDGVPALRRMVARLGDLGAAGSFTVRAPDVELVAASTRSRAATARAALPAAQAGTLVALFALLAALGQRHDHRAAADLLRRRGASRRMLRGFAVADVAWPVVLGSVAGLSLGAGYSAWRAGVEGVGTRSALHALTDARAVLAIAGALVALWLACAWLVSSTDRPPTTGRRWMGSDVAGSIAAVVGVIALARGSTDSTALATRGDPLLALLPLLAVVIVGAAAMRAVPLVAAIARLVISSRHTLTVMAIAPLVRRRRTPLAALGLLTGAVLLGVFALGYRATLDRSAYDAAAFRVPLDASLQLGPALVRPFEREPTVGWASLAPGVVATDVVRRSSGLRLAGLAASTVELLGVEPSALRGLHGWRESFGLSRSDLVQLLTPTAPPAVDGARIPDDATTLQVAATGDLQRAAIGIVIERANNLWHEVQVTQEVLDAGRIDIELEDGDAGGRFIGVRFGVDQFLASRLEHNVGEGTSTFEAAEGFDVRFGDVSVSTPSGSRSIEFDWAPLVVEREAFDAVAVGDELRVTATLQGTSYLLMPTAAVAASVPAVVDATTASGVSAGVVLVDVAGGQLPLRVVGVIERMPGVAGGRFAVTDADSLRLALDVRQPGAGAPNELWLGAPTADARAALHEQLAASRFQDLTVESRGALEHVALSDPLAQVARWSFGLAALISAILALAAIAIAAFADMTEELPLLRAVVGDGAQSSDLRRFVAWRAGLLAAGAIPIGLGGGLLLTQLVGRVVAVTATATAPTVPIRVETPCSTLAVCLVAFALCCAGVAALAARPARRIANSDLLRVAE
jgi:hypothetical protein